MKQIILSVICLIGYTSYAQSDRLKKADNYYNKLSYAYAANLYEKLKGTEEDNTELKSKLATSYLNINNFQKAIEIYSQVVELPEATAEDFYNYAYALKVNGNYTESDRWMKKFAEVKPTDSRAKLFLADQDYKTNIDNGKKYFSLKKSDLSSTSVDFGGYINPAQNQVYVISSRKRNPMVEHEWTWDGRRFLDIYSATYNTDGKTGAVKKMKKVNTKFHEGPLAFSKDGKTVYFTRNNIAQGNKRRDRDKIQNLKIYIADVDSKGRFVNEREFKHNSQEYSVGHPAVSADGKTMFLVSDKPGGIGGPDIYKVEILGPDSFGEMINLGPTINTEGKEMFPYIDANGRLFFSSDGRPGLGGMDVYVSEMKNGSFKKVLNLGHPINSRFDDFAFNMAGDAKKGYVSSNRAGNDDIYSIDEILQINFGVLVNGVAKDKKGNIVPLAKIDIYDDNKVLVNSFTADENGEFKFDTEYDKTFVVNGSKEKYFPGKTTVNTKTDEPSVNFEVIMEKDPGMSLYGVVTDSKTKEPLEGVKVYIIDNFSDKAKTVKTPVTGDFREVLNGKKLNDRGSYNLVLEKEGYFSKTVTYNTVFDREGQYDIHNMINLSLEKEVKDLGELVKIEPINFDLGKAIIRPDAAKELDKIVEVMNRYPYMVIELGAHTDCRGSKASNDALSQKRATASAEYIKKRITAPERIFGKGYGETRLLNDCECEGPKVSTCSEEDHAINRRTEFRVISTGNDKLKVEKPEVDSF